MLWHRRRTGYLLGKNRLQTMSDVLKFLTVQNKDYLLKQKGKPPIARCIDCKRDITAMEMYADCRKCGAGAVCYNCVDKHDHLNLHDFIASLTPN